MSSGKDGECASFSTFAVGAPMARSDQLAGSGHRSRTTGNTAGPYARASLAFAQNRRLANHLLREREALCTFLDCPGLEATNWRAEQAICPMVVRRKVWGGNHTIPGARAQSVPGSIRQTLRQQLRPVSSCLQRLVCSPKT